MKIWADDLRNAPFGYIHCHSVNEIKSIILQYGAENIEILDLDHDAGDYAEHGGDFIRIMDWMEEHNIQIPLHFHTANPVGRRNMENIAKRNGWKIV